jgi:hypothetical protein
LLVRPCRCGSGSGHADAITPATGSCCGAGTSVQYAVKPDLEFSLSRSDL